MKPKFAGILASLGLLIIYFLLVSLISGPSFAISQFTNYWYFILTLAIGFGIQVGLYARLKTLVQTGAKTVVVTTGATSTIAMVSCCSHYLVNILPLLGTVGILTVISQYQIELFWVGIGANILGILYLRNKLRKILK